MGERSDEIYGHAEMSGNPATEEQWESARTLCEILGKPLPQEDISEVKMKQYLGILSDLARKRSLEEKNKTAQIQPPS